MCFAHRCLKAGDYISSSLHPVFLRSLLLLVTTAILLVVRVWLLHGHLPHFSALDNPASFADSFLTRALTYCYLFFFNARCDYCVSWFGIYQVTDWFCMCVVIGNG